MKPLSCLGRSHINSEGEAGPAPSQGRIELFLVFSIWPCKMRRVLPWGKTDPSTFLEMESSLFPKDSSQSLRKYAEIVTVIISHKDIQILSSF